MLLYFFFGRPRFFLGTGSEGISSRKVLAGGTFKARVGFEAKIGIIAKAKVEVGKVKKINIVEKNINNRRAGN